MLCCRKACVDLLFIASCFSLVLHGIMGQDMGSFFETFDYSRDLRPVENHLNPVLVAFNFAPINIIKLDTDENALELSGWIEQNWTDAFFHWNKDDFNGISDMHIPAGSLWTPKTMLYNSKGYSTLVHAAEESLVHITFDGKVTWHVMVHIRAVCRTDMTYFPWDVQACELKFGPPGDMDASKIAMDVSYDHDGAVDLKHYIPSQEWDLTEATQNLNYIYDKSRVAYTTHVAYSFLLARTAHASRYYIILYIIPVVLLSLLGPITFLSPHNGKLPLGAGLLISMIMMFVAMVTTCPKSLSSGVSLIHQYYIGVLVFVIVCIAFGIITCNIANAEYRQTSFSDSQTKVVRMLSKVTCISLPDISKEDQGHEDRNNTRILHEVTAAILDRIFFVLSTVVISAFTVATFLNHPRAF